MLRNISSWAIRNPVPTLLLFAVLTIAGLAGFAKMRINNFPDIDFPMVVVSASEPGAAPAEVETQVTRILEDAVTGLQGIRHVRSTVVDGVSVTYIEFEVGTDLERATNDVRNAVARSRSQLPGDIPEPQVQRIDATGNPMIYYVVRAPGMNPEQLSWFIDNDVSKALLAVPGIAKVNRLGGVTREIRVDLDPGRMAAQGVTAGQVSNALRSFNANLPGGRAEIGGEEQSVRTLGSAGSVQQLADTRVDLGGGRTVRLGDLGEVRDAWSEMRGFARFNGEEVVGFNMTRTRAASEVKAAQQVRKVVEQIDKAHPELKIEEVFSTVQFVEESYFASMEALFLGALLAVAVVFLFLRDWRATFVTAVAMPLSLIPTFAVLEPLNQSFNVVTLLALSLTIGILVDDAIVEIENIVRHMRDGKAPYPAALEAADEIGLAVVATTFTIVAVFAPVGFMPGVVGQFFKSFALAACVSVLFSLLVARMLTPLMSAYLLRTEKNPRGDPAWMRRYLQALRWVLAHKRVTLGIGLAIFIGSLALIPFLPGEFIPAGDEGYSSISVELPPGARLEDTDAVVQRMTTIMRKRPEVTSVYAEVGAGLNASGPGASGGAPGEPRRASLIANYTPKGKRALSQQDLERLFGQEFQSIPGARIRFGVDNSNNVITIALTSDDAAALSATARAVENQMRGVSGLTNVVSSADIARPELEITPLPDQAARAGVSPAAISQAVRVATLGDIDQLLPKFNMGDRQIPIRLRYTTEGRQDLGAIQNMQVPTATGGSVPLSAVADIRFGAGPSQIDRLDRSRSVTITAELNGLALGAASKVVHQLPALKNLPPSVKEKPAGDVEALQQLVGGFVGALFTGILLMHAVLVLLFRSFAHPITIQAALPLAIGGAFGMLLIARLNLSMPALIGILMLMGIAAKNSILLVEYALEAMKRGMTRYDALMDAAHKRARPIVMTTVAMGAGMLPVAAGLGADSEFRQPMAVAVIGGLITSTLLSLLYVPAVFTTVDDIRGWLIRRLHVRFAAQMGEPVEKAAE